MLTNMNFKVLFNTIPIFSYCERRRSALLRHVDEGNREDWWLYLKPEVKPKCEISSWL